MNDNFVRYETGDAITLKDLVKTASQFTQYTHVTHILIRWECDKSRTPWNNTSCTR